ncbi:alpha/beta fold hydrolase [Nocardia australiensis]|uniref:alpha/beta fold hydrolase n=1 Tax=Nocardia australiensis TaxID=2887191 RepID=UPI001D147846|nr:alpha/beta fold hydrolase [Nocardia australiensis]
MELAETLDSHADRPTVVLLHSLGTDHRLWRHQIGSLTAHYDLSTPDSRGHGKSPQAGAVGIDAWTDDLYGVIEDLGPVHLIGLSMGGLQAIAVAAKHPELVRSVTIANSFARLPIDVADARIDSSAESITRNGMAGFAKDYLDQTLTRPLDTADYAALYDAISTMSPEAYLESATATFRADVVPLLDSIACPALVVTGELDAKIPSERTAEILGGIDHAQHEIVPRAGHLSCIENPAHFNAVIASFLARVDDRAAID